MSAFSLSTLAQFQQDWNSEEDQEHPEGPEQGAAKRNRSCEEEGTPDHHLDLQALSASSEGDDWLFERLGWVVCKRDRLLEFAKLTHAKMGDSPARRIPKDVLRMIARLVKPTVVVLSGCYESANRNRFGSVLVKDFAQGYGAWTMPRTPTSIPPPPPRLHLPWALPHSMSHRVARSPDTDFALIFANAPTACDTCRTAPLSPRPHCCCCCPRFLCKQKQGPWEERPSPHKPITNCNVVYHAGAVMLCGGLLMDDHFVMDGCPTANRPTAAVQRYCLQSGQWEDFTPMPMRRMNAAAIVVQERLFVIGGEDGDFMRGFKPLQSALMLEEREWKDVTTTHGLRVGLCDFRHVYLV